MSDNHSQQASVLTRSERLALSALMGLAATRSDLLLALGWAMRASDAASLKGFRPEDEDSQRWQLISAFIRADANEKTTPLEIIWGDMSARQQAESREKLRLAFDLGLNPCNEIPLPAQMEWAGGGERSDPARGFLEALSRLIPILVIPRLPNQGQRTQEPFSRFIQRFADTLPDTPSGAAQRMIRDAFSPLFERALLADDLCEAPRSDRAPRL